MSLATRLSGFFLAAVALLLAAVSVTLFLLAGLHLQRDMDERMTMGLDALLQSVSIDSDEVEWTPGARPTIPGEHPGDDPLRWAVYNDRGRVVDRCWKLNNEDLAKIGAMAPEFGHIHTQFLDSKGESWRLVVRRISASQASDEDQQGSRASAGHDAATVRGRHIASLILAAGTAAAPIEAELRSLAWTLAGVSTIIWLLAATVVRRLIRGALRPMTRMAEAACSMTATDREQSLPIPGTGDELDALAGSFNGLLERLHEEVERQKQFTGDASHQLRTPLTVLLGQVEVALRRDRPAEEYRRALADVHEEAVRLRQIVESLLFLARAESEAGRPDLQPLELAPFVCAHLRKWAVHDRAGDLRADLEPGAKAWVYAHPPLLGQLLDNLLENAAKYGAPGTPIEVRLWRAGDHIALAVQDRGMGLSADDHAHLFEPFYRSAEARGRGYPGVGLGLAMVRRIATLFGGTIEVASEPGRGSTFTLRLPIMRNPTVPSDGPTPAKPLPMPIARA
jgi:heavy metal sensor kinase